MPDFPRRFPRRGEIYWAPLDKVRPVLVVSADQGNQFSNAVVVAALTTTVRPNLPRDNVLLPANDPLPKEGVVLCRNLFSLPKTQLSEFRATLRPAQMQQVDGALLIALALPRP